LTANCGIEPTRLVHYKPILDEALQLAGFNPKKVIIYQRPNLVSYCLICKLILPLVLFCDCRFGTKIFWRTCCKWCEHTEYVRIAASKKSPNSLAQAGV